MTTFEKVTELKKQGASEGDITAKLRAEGISPMEISDALNQAKIKEAIGEKSSTEGMQPSIMKDEYAAPGPLPSSTNEMKMNQAQPPQTMSEEYSPEPTMESQEYAPQYAPQEYPPQEYNPQPNYSEEAEPGNEYYPPEESYGGEEQTYSPGYSGTDTMIEIAEQIFSQKMTSLSKEIKSLIEFKTIYSSKIDDINDRLKRMEHQFDKMQISILDKVGTFGKNIDFLKKEINMVEDSFSKMNSRL